MSKGTKVRASCELGLVDKTMGPPSPVHRTLEPREFRYSDHSMFLLLPADFSLSTATSTSSKKHRVRVHEHICVGIDLPPRWPNGHLGFDSCPDRGRPAQARLVGPRRTVPYKRGWEPLAQSERFTATAVTHRPNPSRSRGWHCQRRDVPPSTATSTPLPGTSLPFQLRQARRYAPLSSPSFSLSLQ
jgi:hypothetical protein